MTNFVRFSPRSWAPPHTHEKEQIVILFKRKFEFHGDIGTICVGELAVVPPRVAHSARTEDARGCEVDVFNPPQGTPAALALDVSPI